MAREHWCIDLLRQVNCAVCDRNHDDHGLVASVDVLICVSVYVCCVSVNVGN